MALSAFRLHSQRAHADASPESSVSHQCGIGRGRQVVYRVQDDPAKAEAMLAEWGM